MRTSNTKQSVFSLRFSLLSLLLGALLLCGLAAELQAAHGTNIQGTGTTAHWTNSVGVWNGASYPGFGATENAFMTTNMGGAYTTLLNTALPNALTTLSISNVSGTATLIVTNNTSTMTTVNVGTGGRLQVDQAAHPSFTALNLTTALNLNGLDPTITINNGGRLVSSAAHTLFSGMSGSTALVVRATPGGAGSFWNMAVATFSVGSGTSLQNVVTFDGGGTDGGLTIDGINQLNLSTAAYSSSNKLNLINGARLYNSGATYVGYSATNLGVVLTVDNSLLSSGAIGIGPGPISGSAGPGGSCSMVVTNGGSVNATTYLGVGNINSTYGGSNNTLWVVGTNSSGSRSTINLNGGSFLLGGNAVGAAGNQATIDNGIITNAGALLLGNGSGANANQLILTNGGKLYTTGASSMGNTGIGNSMLLSGGGALWDLNNSTFQIAFGVSQHNDVTIDGGGVLGGAVVTNVGGTSLTLGGVATSDSNRLNIVRGGRIYVPNVPVYVGYTGGASNQLVVDNGTLIGTNQLAVGLGVAATSRGGSNSVVITNGAFVGMGSLYIGRYATSATDYSSSNNWVIVAGTNSSGDRATLSLGGGVLAMGNVVRSGNNTLTIGNGGIIPDAGAVAIGASTTSGNVFRIVGGVMTNVSLTVATNNYVVFTAGTLAMGSATYDDGTLFNVGDGANTAALLSMNSVGTLTFQGGLLVNSNAVLHGVGTVLSRAVGAYGATITNGAAFAPGLNSPGILTVSNMVWSGGGEYQFDLTDMAGGEGVGRDSLRVLGALILTNTAAGSKPLRITLNSLGSDTANFTQNNNYSLKLAACGSVSNFTASDFQISTNNFLPVSAGTWTVANFENGLYLVYTASGSAAPTADYTWIVPTSGKWNAGNWEGGIPTANGNPAWNLTFGGDGTRYGSTNDLAGTFQLSNMVFNSATPGTTNLIAGNPIEFRGSGGGIQQWGSGSFQVSNSISLAADMTFSGPGLGAVILHTNVSGAGGITKLDAGKLVLQGTNTFAGPVLVNGNGTLEAASGKALGVGSVTVSNGTLLVSAGTVTELGQAGVGGLTGLVTGSGSLWTNNAIFRLGTNSGFNTLTIANTGRMYNAAAASFIGHNGPSNTAVVKDGGLWSLGGQTLTVGSGISATGNLLRLDGTGGVVTNAPLVIGASGGQFNKLVLTNSGSVYGITSASSIGTNASHNNTALVRGGGFWNLGATVLNVGSGGATGNVLRVDDGGVVTNIHTMYVGNTGGQLNSLMITNGGKVFTSVASQSSYIGYGSSNNFAIVEGSNSVGPATLFLGASALCVGNGGGGAAATRDNWLRVGAGGYVEPAYGGIRVGYSSAEGNYVIITNGGVMKTGGGWAGLIGYASSNNYLIVSGVNGTQPSTLNSGASALEIGTGAAAGGGSGNWMRVESGGLVTNFSTVTVGATAKSENNSLIITNGGQFYSTLAGAIGGAASASNNSVLVAGADAGGQKALWYAGGANITVGSGTGTGNVLRVGNGGVFSNAVFLFTTPTPANSVLVENGGAAYAGLVVGSTASCVSNPVITAPDGNLWEPGAYVWNGVGAMFAVGNGAASKSNYLWVSGRTLTNFGAVNIGNGAGDLENRLVLTNGARLYSTGAGVVGSLTASTNNTVLIAGGAGVQSVWAHGGDITVGGGGRDNLVVDGRGTFGSALLTSNAVAVCRVAQNGQPSEVLVTNEGYVVLGSDLSYGGSPSQTSSSNRLVVSAGSILSSDAYGAAMMSQSGNDNLWLVTGTNAMWEGRRPGGGTSTHLFVGNGSSRNALRIEDGGVVTGMNVIVGYGGSPANNLLSITGGGKMYSKRVYCWIGYLSDGNTGIVSGAGSLWDVGADLSASSGAALNMTGRSNVLMIADGGVVTNIGGYSYPAIYFGLCVGYTDPSAFANQVVVTNGGKLFCAPGFVSFVGGWAGNTSNKVTVTGSGSLWDLALGGLTVGVANSSTGNVLTIDQDGTVDNIGTLTIWSNNAVLLNGGTLGMAAAAVAGPGSIFQVGDGTQSATLKALAGGSCNFTNGLLVNDKATLAGVGRVAGGVSGVVLTNGAILSAGVNGIGTLTLSNTTWYGGATNVVEITDVSGFAGEGYDTVIINTQLTLTAATKTFVVKMDSKGGNANFQSGQDYLLKFMTCVTSPASINLSQFAVDTTAFTPPGGTWWVTNIGYSLYLATTGAVPVSSSYQWDPIKTGNWDNVANWLNGAAPPSGGDATNVLEFGGSGVQSYTATNNLGIDHLLSNLLLTSTSTGTNILTGQQLKFTGSGSGILLQGTGWTISSNRMNWADSLLLGGSGVGGMILASNLVGTGAVTVASGGTYVMAGSNAFRGDLLVNCSGSGKLRIDNANALGSNSVVVSNGTLQITPAFILGGTNQPNLSGLVTGSGSLWTNVGTFTLGMNSSFNTLTIANTGRMYVVGGAIGDGGSSNTAVVKDGGLWNLKATTFTIGNASATGNVVRVEGVGTVITNASLRVGAFAGRDNKLVLNNNGAVYSTASTIGHRATNNTVLVGGGGIWNFVGAQLIIGEGNGGGASGNVLRVDDGGLVTNISIVVGNNINGSQLNGVVITNGGRMYLAAGTQHIGLGGSSNNYIIVEGTNSVGMPATLSCSTIAGTRFYVGQTLQSRGNWLRVGSGGLVSFLPQSTAPGISVGFNDWGNNYMLVTNGGQVVSGNSASYPSRLGYGSSNNYVLVTGSNVNQVSTWDGGGSALAIGNPGTGNWMRVEAGGVATNFGLVTTGAGATDSGNSLTITNGGSMYVTGLTMASGNSAGLNQVGVYANGFLAGANFAISIGTGLTTLSNSLTVGVGGIVTNVGALIVGNPTGTNQLYVSGGTLSVSNLVCTNVNNTITFAAGRLNLRGAFVSNTVPLLVGDGAQSAILSLGPAGRTNIFAHGLTITNKATLTGVGGITGNTTVYGTNSPGTEGIGVITNSGNFTLAASSVSRFEIGTNTTAGSGWDHLVLTGGGTLTVGGTLKPILTGGFSPTNTMSFVIMTNTTASVSGSFANEVSGKVNVFTNDSQTTIAGTFNVTVSNSQYVVLTNFKPPLASGTIFKFR